MDGSSFDTLARLAASDSSRRSILTSALGAALAELGAASLLGAHKAEAKNRKRKRRRKRTKNGCNPSCGANETCQNGTCVCEPNCGANTCGDDGCGGSCGACEPNATCDDGDCVCVPDCDGSACGDDGCGGTCTCDDQSFCQDETCVPCNFPCPAGERCVHGTCTCGASGGNNCPFEGPTDQCACSGQTVDGVGKTCADKFSACPQDTPCTTHDDCPVGTVCKTTCVDPDDPLGPNRCSNPCIPV